MHKSGEILKNAFPVLSSRLCKPLWVGRFSRTFFFFSECSELGRLSLQSDFARDDVVIEGLGQGNVGFLRRVQEVERLPDALGAEAIFDQLPFPLFERLSHVQGRLNS